MGWSGREAHRVSTLCLPVRKQPLVRVSDKVIGEDVRRTRVFGLSGFWPAPVEPRGVVLGPNREKRAFW